MNRIFRLRSFALVALLALGAAAVAAGCAKKVTSVDSSFTKLEGVPDARTILMIYPEETAASSVWADTLDSGVDLPGHPGDGLDRRTDSTYARPTGLLHVLLLDGTKASGFELFRSAPNGGLMKVSDFHLVADRKWLSTGWEAYESTVGIPAGYTPSFVARGLLAGVAGPQSPLSNVTTPATALFTPTITYRDSLVPSDSLFNISWSAVPGAAGYWLQVYSFSSRATTLEQASSGQPTPIWNGNVNNNFVGYVAAPATHYKLGSPGALVLTFSPPIRNREYRVRVTAVDAAGRVIAYLAARDFLDDLIQITVSTKSYVRWPLASVTVHPQLTRNRYDHNFE